ncbi:MAG: toxin [Fidelibacterota bacterium]
MKSFNWNRNKNNWLKENRKISFEDIVFYINNGFLIDDINHPNTEKYKNQRIFLVDIKNYVHLVPYVENRKEFFLKTIIPSRKMTKQYLGDKK